MAWPAATFTYRSFADLAGDLASLCLAINQRQFALDSTLGSEYRFTIADGTTKARPSASDLSGFVISQEAFRDTIVEVQTVAKGLADNGTDLLLSQIGGWLTTSTGSTFYTHADILKLNAVGGSTAQDGTISSVFNDVFGTGTTFTADLSVGDVITAGSQNRTISRIVSDTRLEVEEGRDSTGAIRAGFYPAITDESFTSVPGFGATFNAWDQNVWERLRQYMDRLIYFYAPMTVHRVTVLSEAEDRGHSYPNYLCDHCFFITDSDAVKNAAADGAWDDAKTLSSFSALTLLQRVIDFRGSPWGIYVRYGVFVDMSDDQQLLLNTSKFSGTVSKATATVLGPPSGATPEYEEVVLAGIDAFAPTDGSVSVDVTSAVSLSSNYILTLSWKDAPSAFPPGNPLSDPPVDNVASLAGTPYLELWLNFTSVLTDQA